jgi:hypothetical protein
MGLIKIMVREGIVRTIENWVLKKRFFKMTLQEKALSPNNVI